MSLVKRETILVLALAIALKAITAVHGAIATRLEGHLGGGAAAVADHFIHLPLPAAGVLAVTAGTAAGGATAGLILESLVSKELLFGS